MDSERMQWDHSWYRPGAWTLPLWWTDGVLARGDRLTHAEQETFYNGWFVREVLGHTGGLTRPPRDLEEESERNTNTERNRTT